jgi:hypothetical protein
MQSASHCIIFRHKIRLRNYCLPTFNFEKIFYQRNINTRPIFPLNLIPLVKTMIKVILDDLEINLDSSSKCLLWKVLLVFKSKIYSYFHILTWMIQYIFLNDRVFSFLSWLIIKRNNIIMFETWKNLIENSTQSEFLFNYLSDRIKLIIHFN